MEVKLLKYEQQFGCSGTCPKEALFQVLVGDQLVANKAITCSTPTEFVVPSGENVMMTLQFQDGEAQVREFVSGQATEPVGCFGDLVILGETQVEL